MSASKSTTGRKTTSKPAPIKTKYIPVFTGPIEGWVVNFLKKNAWRVARTMEFEDCLQEANLVFLRVARTYPDIMDAPHFMSLFQTSWTRRFNDLSTEDTSVREAEVPMFMDRSGEDGDAESGSFLADYVGELNNEGELAVVLRQAPREVSLVLNLLLKAPQELLDLCLGSWRGRDRRMRGGGSEHINRLLGLPESFDSLQRVEDYFRGATRH